MVPVIIDCSWWFEELERTRMLIIKEDSVNWICEFTPFHHSPHVKSQSRCGIYIQYRLDGTFRQGFQNISKWPPLLTWWRHQMETFSALLALCAGNSPVSGEFPAQRPVTRSFDVFFICAWRNAWVITYPFPNFNQTLVMKSNFTKHFVMGVTTYPC